MGATKTETKPQYYRIRRIVQMVREGSQSGEPPNSTDFILLTADRGAVPRQ